MNLASQIVEDITNIRLALKATPPDLESRAPHMQRLWHTMSKVTDERIVREIASHRHYADLSAFFADEWGTYISATEKHHSMTLAKGKSRGSVATIEDYTKGVDELSFVPSSLRGREFVMVGCGPFPETVIDAYEKDGWFTKVTGVDRNEDSLRLATKVFFQLAKNEVCKSVGFSLADGTTFDYSNAAVVFMANGLRGKRDILQRIFKTMPDDGVVMVRNPALLAKLVYEDVHAEGKIEGLKLVGSVRPSPLSQTFALRKDVA